MTVSWVAVAADTVPAAPRLNATVLLPAVVSNPVPVMVNELALIARLAVDSVTVGAGTPTVIIFAPQVYVTPPEVIPRLGNCVLPIVIVELIAPPVNPMGR